MLIVKQRWAYVVCIGKVVVIGFLLCAVMLLPPKCKETVSWQLRIHQVKRARCILESWQTAPQACVGCENEWYMAWDSVNSFIGNVCYIPSTLSQSQLERMVDKLEVLSRQPVTVETLDQANRTIASGSEATKTYANNHSAFHYFYEQLKGKGLGQ